MKAPAFAILGFSLVAQAHAGPPKSLDITEQRNEAVGFAIAQAVAVNDMRLACEGVPDAGTRFSDAERRWLKRNGSYPDAARGWMAYVKVAIAEQEGSVAADAFSSRTNPRFTDQASKIAADACRVPPSMPNIAIDGLPLSMQGKVIWNRTRSTRTTCRTFARSTNQWRLGAIIPSRAIRKI